MLLFSLSLAAAPIFASSIQDADNPFQQTGSATTGGVRKASFQRRPVHRAAVARSGGTVYYANCAAARAAGAAPVMRGAPGYSRKLDRDDGVGCE